ncbi:uncharacterized protein FIBRA_03468 [Fibroporia radiculosa]|uniref:Cytochrome P450 n=1 Tax=Fibroporia radiculosa TaxID=599839 RepID=J4HW04_9APHY|nr:uncharacterized protein FIBRA_03468 [Fibroporia radiculosa]CCM01417.1 predicted protein [Fibroporia radiculosa]
MSYSPGALAGVIILILVYFTFSGRRTAHRPPPGPKPIPILGNVHQLPSEYQWREFAQWAVKYGDVFYFQIFRKPALVINSVGAAHDLLERRSSKYSDRPRTVVLTELQVGAVYSTLPYGNQWRQHRKWFQTAFQTKSSQQNHKPLVRRGTRWLLSLLLENPAEFEWHIKRFSGATMLEIAYGHPATSPDDELMRFADDTLRKIFVLSGSGSSIIDFISVLRFVPDWMPGARVQRKSRELSHLVRALYDIPYERVKSAMAGGTARQSFLTSLLEQGSVNGGLTEKEYDIKGAAAQVYIAGTETTVTVLLTFMLAMVLHPEVFKKAQAEIDRVVGHSRLPDPNDRSSLPYLEHVLKEVYRWGCPVPLAIAHQSIADDEYRGYHIPTGSVIIPNIWAMMRNPTVYPEPERFLPERFENLDADTIAAIDPLKAVFGFGRRICPGRTFGDSTVWLTAASILSAFDVRKARDAAGEEITPEPKFSDGLVRHPPSFKCDIKPRSSREAELIRLLNMDGLGGV